MGQTSLKVCLLEPPSHKNGAPCRPPVTSSGKLVVYSSLNHACGTWTVTQVCARGSWIPGADWICKHQTGTLQILNAVLLSASFIATFGESAGLAAEIEAAENGVTEGAEAGEEIADEAAACHSFDPHTRVLMADGNLKAISKIKVFDLVRATNPVTGVSSIRPVIATMVHQDADLMDVTVTAASGHSGVLHTNAHHRFWDASQHTWLRVDQLHIGDRLTTAEGPRPRLRP